MPEFRVEFVNVSDRQEGAEVVEAMSPEAARLMVERGSIRVARIIPLPPVTPAQDSVPPRTYAVPTLTSLDAQPIPGNGLAITGIVLAYLGLVLWPVALLGAIFGMFARQQSNGRVGTHAVIAGLIVGVVSMFCVGSMIVSGVMGR